MLDAPKPGAPRPLRVADHHFPHITPEAEKRLGNILQWNFIAPQLIQNLIDHLNAWRGIVELHTTHILRRPNDVTRKPMRVLWPSGISQANFHNSPYNVREP